MTEPVVVDTGPFVALFDASDAYHQGALQFVLRQEKVLYSNLAVVTEAMHLLDFHLDAQRDFLDWVRAGAVALMAPETEDLERACALMAKYADLPADFTDALLVAQCERIETRRIATLDDDFTVYRYRDQSAFQNLFPGPRT